MHSPVICEWNAYLNRSVEIWPDGCRDLIIGIPDSGSPIALLTQLDKKPRQINQNQSMHYFGVRFSPGSQLSWDNYRAHASSADSQVSHLGKEFFLWYEGIRKPPDRPQELLNEAVERWVKPRSSLVNEFFAVLNESSAEQHVFQKSERTYRRQIVTQTGAPPSFWRQLLRARRAANNLITKEQSLVELATAHGYADQAHFSRDIKRWFGQTPSAIRAAPETPRVLLSAEDGFMST